MLGWPRVVKFVYFIFMVTLFPVLFWTTFCIMHKMWFWLSLFIVLVPFHIARNYLRVPWTAHEYVLLCILLVMLAACFELHILCPNWMYYFGISTQTFDRTWNYRLWILSTSAILDVSVRPQSTLVLLHIGFLVSHVLSYYCFILFLLFVFVVILYYNRMLYWTFMKLMLVSPTSAAISIVLNLW